MSKKVDEFSLKNNKICINIDVCSKGKHFLTKREYTSFLFYKSKYIYIKKILTNFQKEN